MQQYLMTVPETSQAQNLLNYVIQSGFFQEVKQMNTNKKKIQKKQLKDDLTEAFKEVELIRQGKLEKQTLREFIDEL